MHPDYSIDASPFSMRDYCKKALELNLSEICFTTHVELDSLRSDNLVRLNGEKISVLDFRWLDSYFEEIAKVREEFKPAGLEVKAGLEVGYSRGCEKQVEKTVNSYPFDFVMGAIHCLDHIAISSMKESPRYFQSKSLEELRKDYFGTLMEMAGTGLFDSIAHVDIYLRYGVRIYGPVIYAIHKGAVEPVFAEMARRGMGLEVNTSSRRRGLKEFHPARDMLALAAKSGIKVFTVGSDAHSPEELGGHIAEALEILQEHGLRNHTFTRRRARPV